MPSARRNLDSRLAAGPTTPTGPLDETERAAAVTICDRATDRYDATRMLDMCGLLRQGGAR